MILPFHRRGIESWEALRSRMLRETEFFLEDGLRNPERFIRIPAIPVGSGAFARGFADAFWSQVLATP